MSRTYEFFEDRMSYLNKDTFNKYYGMKMYYQFTPKVGDIPTLKKYVFKEENDLVRGILNRPVVTVEVKNAEDADKVYIEEVLPAKMRYNLESLKKFGLKSDMSVLWNTFVSVIH